MTTWLKVMNFFVLIFLTFPMLTLASDSEDNVFQPTLTINEAPVCDALLTDVRQKFMTGFNFYHYFPQKINVDGMTPLSWPLYDDPDIDIEEVKNRNGYPVPTAVIHLNNEKLYLHDITHNGCGGACETYSLLPSSDPDRFQKVEPEALSPNATSYRFYKTSTGAIRLLQQNGKNELQMLDVIGDKKWKMVCNVQLTPSNLYDNKVPSFLAAREQVSSLKMSVSEMMRGSGGSGDCGSMRTHSRWWTDFNEMLDVLWYRPWIFEEEKEYVDTYGTYEKDIKGLADWAKLGELEHDAFNHYLSQLEITIPTLAKYYEKHFNWLPEKAESTARTALTEAVSSTIRFYYFEPFDDTEKKLRQAILEKQSMDVISELGSNYFSKVDGQYEGNYHNESLLNIATKYPEAMLYLLKQGLDPNKQNDFGKTPLMYAAQNNQLEAVKLLLEFGADPNRVTYKPIDTCFYTLDTVNTTALHYAVRYASPELIKLLIDGKAATYIEAKSSYSPIGEGKPIDWLNHYTDINNKEINPNIPQASLAMVASLLTPKVDLVTEVNELILDAESLYQKQSISDAYNKLSLALQIDSDNERALSDMSITALRDSKLSDSIGASMRLIRSGASDKTKANAYYNYGLACSEKEGERHRMVNFNGDYYCHTSYNLYAFLKAYSLHPTDSRKEKLQSQIDKINPSTSTFCQLKDLSVKMTVRDDIEPSLTKYNREGKYILMAHDNNLNITKDDFSWNARPYNEKNESEPFELKRIETFVSNTHTLSVFQLPKGTSINPYEIFGQKCET